ncbi:macro domain-containing protein [Microvirga brassicacearum]|uniref:Macro domain-containing protein n=1 Tax=Microvirga brassicacearum TaxID=2580413 RepID=A0A5N3PFH5_9HYPH|nr:macro domain-containing protein [Microvirga brassicacearum]KAB0268473.1 macro domain-containing protein [Microvirga brassicacearum]
MIKFTQGNLFESNVDALVNTVNTVGVMGKGIALMFKEAYPENFKAYETACKQGTVQVGRMFVTERNQLIGPKWIINFPTKKHWRHPSKMEWIEEGLADLKNVIRENRIRSLALPPLGSGNGGLDWADVRPKIEAALGSLAGVEIVVFEPTHKYHNVAKRAGVEKLTPARALVAELVRRYWILGIECTLLEVQKLAYFLERSIEASELVNPLDLRFEANRFGPFAPRLTHLLNALDGSYLHSEKRLADAGPLDVIHFEDSKKDKVAAYLTSPEVKEYRSALEATTGLIDGFESPLGMELLATVDWLVHQQGIKPNLEDVKSGLREWPGGVNAANRKQKLFDDRLLTLALSRLLRTDAAAAPA